MHRGKRHYLELAFPETPWREPIMIRLRPAGAELFACRLCIAHGKFFGMEAAKAAFSTREEYDHHMRSAHRLEDG